MVDTAKIFPIDIGQAVIGLDLSVLHDSEADPELLSALGRKVLEMASLPYVVAVLREIEVGDRSYDWNAAVVLSRLDGGLTAEAMSCVALGERHLNSTGLTWALGEMPNHRIETIHWLERVIVETKKSKTWWRAAFSLQKLGQGDAVERLMRDVGRTGLPSLAECLDDLGDERNMIAALIHANSSSEAMRSVAASVRESYLEAEDDPSLVNCAWLIGRLRIMDEEILERVRGLSIDPSHDVRYYALYALQNNSTPAGEDIAVRALDDADPLIRRIAVRVLGVIGTDTARLALLSLMRREHDPKVVSEAENQMVQTT